MFHRSRLPSDKVSKPSKPIPTGAISAELVVATTVAVTIALVALTAVGNFGSGAEGSEQGSNS